ncbi:CopG family transcriptional regulator [Martelella mangrovi]|uniref:Transcriptional regulator n=1 Tax=Martelella mangrovi TaxID=1397477 RepID=A0ABV2IEW0_9HYPH
MVIIPKLSLDNDLAEQLAEMADHYGVSLEHMIRVAIDREYGQFEKWRYTFQPDATPPGLANSTCR